MSRQFEELKNRIAHREALAREGKVLLGDVLDKVREKRLGPGCLSDKEIEPYVERRLPLLRRISVWRHIRHCPVCRHDVVEFREARSAALVFEKELALRRDSTKSRPASERPADALTWVYTLREAFGLSGRLAGATSLLLLAVVAGAMALFGAAQLDKGSVETVSRGVESGGELMRIGVTLMAVVALVAGAFVLSFLCRRSGVTSAEAGGTITPPARIRWMRASLTAVVILAMAAALLGILRLVLPTTGHAKPAGGQGLNVPGLERTHYAALVVGINNWSADPRLQGRPLAGAANDAKLISKLWKDAGYSISLLTQDGPQSSAPTLANITSNLVLLARSCRDMTNASVHLRVYWAGHGVGGSGTAYLIPSDGILGDLAGTCITRDGISRIFSEQGVALGSLAIMTDACWLGVDNISGDFISALTRSAGKWGLVTACSDGQLSYEIRQYPKQAWDMPEAKVPHGLFTFLMAASRYGPFRGGKIAAPGDRDGDGKITWKEAFDFAAEQMPRLGPLYAQWRGTGTGIQRPQMFGHVSPEFTDAVFCLAEPIPSSAITDTILPDQIFPPITDQSGRFHIYSDFSTGALPPVPFVPYGWYWRNSLGNTLSPTAIQQMMEYDISDTNQPYGGGGTCVTWTLRWKGQTTASTNSEPWDLSWAGVGWVSGPDIPAWWAQDGDNRGRYYNLESPRQYKSLRFAARSPQDGTRLRVKIGILSRDAAQKPLVLGDSLAGPIEYVVVLKSTWETFEVPLTFNSNVARQYAPEGHACLGANTICQICGNNPVNPRRNDLSRICSLGFVLEKADQPGTNTNNVTHVMVDNIYFEPFPQFQ